MERPKREIERRKFPVEIPVFHPAMEPVEKAAAEGAVRGEIEFKRNVVSEEIRDFAISYEYAFRSLAEEAEAKRKVEKENDPAELPHPEAPQRQKRSLKNLFKRKKAELAANRENEDIEARVKGLVEEKGFTQSPKFPFIIGYHREVKDEMNYIVPDYYEQKLNPAEEIEHNKIIESKLSVEFVKGEISALIFSGGIYMDNWYKDGHRNVPFGSKEDKRERNKRTERFIGQLPLIKKLKNKDYSYWENGKMHNDTYFEQASVSLEVRNKDGAVYKNPILIVKHRGWLGLYEYDFLNNEFKFKSDSLIHEITRKSYSEFHKGVPFAETLDVTPTDIMQQMLDLIPTR